MNAISPARLQAAMSAAMQLKASLTAEDDELIAALVESEADALALLDRLGEQAIADRLLAEVAAERIKRLEARAKRTRELIQRMLEAIGLKKLERPTFTASIQAAPRSVVITDPAAVPEDYLRPDKPEIARALKAGQEVPGAMLGNTTTSLRLLTK